jgi:hypothetical protein
VARAKKGKKAAPGTWVERDLFNSRAYLELTGFAPQLLILFLGKRDISSDRLVRNKDAITMTFAELEGFYLSHESKGLRGLREDLPKGISRPRIVRAIDGLLSHGFIRIVRRGGAYQQDKTVYGLVDDWRLWQPGNAIRTREPDTRAMGYNGKRKKSNLAYETVPIHTNETVPMRN